MSHGNAGAGAPIGNQNAIKAKRWQKAIERGLARFCNSTVDDGLDKVADIVISAALDGDKDAWKEIGDRLDGKSVQQISGPNGGDIPIGVGVTFVGTTPGKVSE